ncbi:MAG: hypothetical protein NTY88_05125 [Bacteroidetes bacterium]|nr:hypothetical protein [Bacteroidota bacterium]
MTRENLEEYFVDLRGETYEKCEILEGKLLDDYNMLVNTRTHVAGEDFRLKVSPFNKDGEKAIRIFETLLDGLEHVVGAHEEYDVDLRIEVFMKKR